MERSKEGKNIILSLILISVNIIYAIICYTVIYPNINSKAFHESTSYIIRTDFLIAFIPLNTISLILFLGIGKLTFSEMGLKKSGFFFAIVLVYVIWWITQIAYLIIDLILQINPLMPSSWSNPIYPYYLLGEFITEYLGNSLFEEILYRGVFFTQLFLYFKLKDKFSSERKQLIIAMIISQLLFALAHIPNRFLSGGYNLEEALLGLLSPFIFGLFLCYIYYYTDNLFISMGLHGLGNIAVSLVPVEFPPSQWSLFIIITVFFISILYEEKTTNRDKKESIK